jgi:sugar/nucleoside kinase (ribokinase family)
MFDVMTIGTLTIDLYFRSDCLTIKEGRFELAQGGKYFTDHFYESLGGGATNVALGLQSHGIRTALKTIIGKNSFKPFVVQKLQESGVSYLHSKIENNHLNISCILLAPNGEKTVINYQSPHQHMFTQPDDFTSLLRAKTFYVANLPDVSFYDKVKLLSYLRKNNKQIVLNLGVRDCRRDKDQLAELIENVDVLIVNGYEYADMIKKRYDMLDFHQNVVELYLPSFMNRTVVITDGEKGSYGYHNGKVFYQQSIRPQTIVDSTGAGDAYSAGFIASYIKTGDTEKAMHSGARYACHILGKIGAN